MPKILNLPEKEICEEYLNGIHIYQIAERYNCSSGPIKQILLNNNIRFRTISEIGISHRVKKITKNCLYCNKEFKVTPGNSKRIFCCKKCVNDWNSENRRGENSTTWVEKLTITCEYCGKEFKIYPKNVDTRFCSKDCWHAWQSENIRGDNHHNYNGSIIKLCKYCNKKIILPLYSEEQQFCSRDCYWSWMRLQYGENTNNWQGGISFDPYCEKFNEVKKKEVRNKYNNCDYLTGIHRDICNIVSGRVEELSVHHFDYDKMQGCNDHEWKLIPVSRKHNIMFNKDRPFWKRLIEYALEYDEQYY